MFSKVSREKSGGETQVPFYIVIAATFQQLLTRNKRVSSGCIVLFDEAFNNMDESRIEAMMKYYSSLSIQIIFAIPPTRRSEEHTSELQSRPHLVCRLLLEKKKKKK